MPIDRFTDGLVLQARRVTHLAVLRFGLTLGYLFIEGAGAIAGDASVSAIVGAVVVCYSAGLLIYRRSPRIRGSLQVILAVDLVAMATLALLSTNAETGMALLLFYFLVIEAALLHEAREVLIVTGVSVLFWLTRLFISTPSDYRFSFSSLLFLLMVGGALGYYFSIQSQRLERRIGEALVRAPGQSEAQLVVAVESALQELTVWLKCSRAVLAFWDPKADYYALCIYPPRRDASDPAPIEFDSRQEWACFVGKNLDFHSNDVSLPEGQDSSIHREFDLHPYIIQTLEIYNAVGCGLREGENIVGRLLIFNSPGGASNGQMRRLIEVSHLFREAILHLLVVRRTEHEAYERERVRMAHDLHDGPLQSIISFEMRLNIIRKLRERDPEAAERDLVALYDFSRKLVSEMRTFILRMRPVESDDISLRASTKRLIDAFQKESGVAITMMSDPGAEFPATGEVKGQVLKIAREALHNVYKHSQATHVLFSMERKNGDLHLSVDDNGRGYDFSGKFGLDELDSLHLGPRSVKQRVRGLGGSLSVESNPGHGSNLHVVVPLDAEWNG
ncbi:MAG: sensor histidine kinase [Acidobacteria bacterium]|nr:sensor histidine kinase [Acidobacteriota bacterium]